MHTYFLLPCGIPNDLSIGKQSFLNKLCWSAYHNRTDVRGYVAMNSRVLRHVMGKRHYKREIDEMIDDKLIRVYARNGKVNGSYQTAIPKLGIRGVSKCYRLHHRWRGVEFETVEVQCDSRRSRGLVGRLKDASRNGERSELRRVADLPNGPAYMHIYDTLCRRMSTGKVEWEKFGLRFDDGERDQRVAGVRAFWNRLVEGWLHDRPDLRWFHVCDYERLHANTTNLRNDLLPFLSLDGQKLAEVDVKTSQVVFLAELVAEHGASGSGDLSTIAEEGVLYDMIASRAEVDRDTAKGAFFHWTYGLPGSDAEGKRPCAEFFEARLPYVARLIGDIKRKRGYRWLAREMQRREAQLIFGQVVPKLQQMDVPLITRHDSVIVPASASPDAMSAMSKSFQEIGLTARCEPNFLVPWMYITAAMAIAQ